MNTTDIAAAHAAPELREIQAVPILERDANGEWAHPGLPDFDEDATKYKAWLEAQGLETSTYLLEYEDNAHPAYVAYFERGESSFREWLPERPAGEGWFTLAISDTENGPAWIWARRVHPAAEQGEPA